MARLLLVILALIGVLGSGLVHAGSPMTFPGSNYGPIPDGLVPVPGNYGAPRDIAFAVSGLPGTVSTAAVSFSADHLWVGDLRVQLFAPNGKQHLLFEHTLATTAGSSGSSGNLLATNTYDFRDNNATNWWTAVATNGDIPSTNARTVISGGAGVSNPPPVTSMNASFAATPANGTWILRFEDGFATDAGSVTAASLTLNMVGSNQVVTTASDSGAGSLRAAMTLANVGDLITFDPSLFGTPQTIELLTALPDIDFSGAIQGPGADLLTVRRSDTAADFRIFTVPGAATNVAISGMTISNGRDTAGGGIYSIGRLTLSRVVLSGNYTSGSGGGLNLISESLVYASSIIGNTANLQGGGITFASDDGGALRLIDSTVSGNTAGDSYGGILFASSSATGRLEVGNSTIAYNAATSTGGIGTIAEGAGITATTTLRNSIVANNPPRNVSTVSFADGVAMTVSSGFNLSDNWGGITSLQSTDVTGDARLGPLAPQGGSTPTHLLLGGSEALDKGNRSGAAGDQRNAPRAFDIASITDGSDSADIGAVEMQAIIVTTASDTGAGSLREAITSANGNGSGLDDIIFDNGVFNTPQTIPLATALPDIASAMTLSGPGAKQLSVRRNDAAANFQIFHALPNLSNVAFSGMTITNGVRGIHSQSDLSLVAVALIDNLSAAGAGSGLVATTCNVFISGSTISGNVSSSGGGIFYVGSGEHVVRLINSTVSGNSASNVGGGILNLSSSGNSRLEVINSTFANNTAPFQGRTIAMQASGIGSSTTTILRNSIIASNSPPNLSAQTPSGGGPAVFVSRGFNLASDDSSAFLNQASDQNSGNTGLLPLADNGGPTFTHALGLSDAIDGGNNSGSGVTAGQRGNAFTRTVDLALPNVPGGDGTDIGAYEAQSEPITDRLFASGFE